MYTSADARMNNDPKGVNGVIEFRKQTPAYETCIRRIANRCGGFIERRKNNMHFQLMQVHVLFNFEKQHKCK